MHYVHLYENAHIFSYYHVADGVLFIYDLQNTNTFSAISKWLKDFKEINKNAEILIGMYKKKSYIDLTICIFLIQFQEKSFY